MRKLFVILIILFIWTTPLLASEKEPGLFFIDTFQKALEFGAGSLTISCGDKEIVLTEQMLVTMKAEDLQKLVTLKMLFELRMNDTINCYWVKTLFPKQYNKEEETK